MERRVKRNMINRYLKFGTEKEFDYSEPVSAIDIDWEDAKREFRDRLTHSVNRYRFSYDGLALCGTMNACCYMAVSERTMPTFSVDVGFDTGKLSKLLGCNNYTLPINNVELCIKEVHALNPFLRSSIEDMYSYNRQGFFGERGHKLMLCEGGSDYLLASDNNLMKLAISKGEYSIKKALDVRSTIVVNQSYVHFDTYEDCFNHTVSIFTDEEINEFGLEPPRIKLREDNLEHYLKAIYDWGLQTIYEQRTNVFADNFDFIIYSPFINDEQMVNFGLSLPLEYKYCLGRRKHILKEAVPLDPEIKKNITNMIFPRIWKTIEPEVKILLEKYFKKDSVIFDHLPYDVVMRHINDTNEWSFIKKWNLLNLSIWLESKHTKHS
jgi:hypothetical protein